MSNPMAVTIRVSTALPLGGTVKIFNPVAGGSGFTSRKRADRFVRNDRAHYDSSGRLVFHGQPSDKTSKVRLSVKSFSGMDAFPGRPVCPPSPEVLMRQMNPHRRVE